MPGPLLAFFILLGLGSGSALLGPPPIWSGIDPLEHGGRMTRNQVLYDELGLRGYEPPCTCKR